MKLSEKPASRRVEEWQKDAWRLYKEVGEVQHAIDYVANHLSKIRLFGAHVPPDPRDAPLSDASPIAQAAVNALKTSGGSYSAILREIAINLFVPGECFLVGQGSDNEVESWEVRSTDELSISDNLFLIRDYPGGPRREYTDKDIVVINIMLSDPQWGGLPISPLRGVLASGEEIQRIERVIRAAARSRSAGPGLLLMPEEASFGSLQPTQENSETPQDPFMTALIDAMVTPIQDEGSASAVVPMLVRAPGDVLDKIRKVSLAIDIDTELIKLDRALTRLAQGLPLPPEIVTGKAGLNHWTGFGVDEAVIHAYVEPLASPIVDALTSEYYLPYLAANGQSDTSSSMLWYDVTPLIARPNRSADADFGLDHNAISDKAWRRIKGLTEEDAPTALEKITRLILQRGSFDPIFTSVILKELGLLDERAPAPINVINQPPSPGPAPALPAPKTGTPAKNRPTKGGAPAPRGPGATASVIIMPAELIDADDIAGQLTALDRDLRIRLQALADAAVTRAMEKACSTILSKLRNHSRLGPVLRDTPKLQAAIRVGRPALEAEGIHLSDLLNGAFDTIFQSFVVQTQRTYVKASRVTGVSITVPKGSIKEAAGDLAVALVEFASRGLTEVTAREAALGELDDTTLAPPQIVREALRRAGGGGPQLLPSQASPPTAIATGPIVLSAMLNAGWSIEGWEWDYTGSVRTRDYEPHQSLDGMRFGAFTDPVLANHGSWPPVAFHYPGDHEGCSCSLRPVLVAPAPEGST